MAAGTKPDLQYLDWQVESRWQIQKLLLELYGFIREHSGELDEAWKRDLFDSVCSGAFSLWRAIFLTETSRDWESASPALESFLSSLVADNSITYQDDKRNRAWSVGYYMENAALRLSHMVHLLKETGNVPEDAGPILPGHSAQTAFGSQQEWFMLFRAMQYYFGVVNRRYPNPYRDLP
jgi:hypothetical protein